MPADARQTPVAGYKGRTKQQKSDSISADPPPLIVISYSKEEEKWKDQLVSALPTELQV